MRLAGMCRVLAFGFLAACGSSDETSSDAQTPPTTGASDVEKWLADGAYKTWTCEPTVHESRNPSPHGFNRICTNDLISNAAKATGVWPKGAAAVKELYNAATDTTPAGYSVEVKLADDSAGGANWYWYERLPGQNNAIADGKGDSGNPKNICVGCHKAAGADAAHTPTTGGRDLVYTPIP